MGRPGPGGTSPEFPGMGPVPPWSRSQARPSSLCLRSGAPGQEEVFYLLVIFLVGWCPAALTSPGQKQPKLQRQRESYTDREDCSLEPVHSLKPSSPQNHSWKDSHPTCTHGCCRSYAGAEGPRAGGFPQPPPCPDLAPARSHGTAWHQLIIKAKSFAGRETQTSLKLPPRNGHSEGQCRLLVPHKLVFCLIEQQLRAVLIPAQSCASTMLLDSSQWQELLLPQGHCSLQDPLHINFAWQLAQAVLLIVAVLSLVAH